MYHYGSALEAINNLRERGYTEDFNLAENCMICRNTKYNASDFEIREVYRFEGDSNPDDESVVYGIESRDGVRGILVNGYGISAEPMSAEIARKLRIDAH